MAFALTKAVERHMLSNAAPGPHSMKTYGQFCPLAQATQLLCERWTLIVVRELMAGSSRFGELHHGAPLMSPTLLSTRLKQLVKAGVVEQRGGGPSSPTYHLTDAGMALRPIIEHLGIWGHRWAGASLQDDDMDAGLLMWDMRRSIDVQAFPDQRVVVQFEYPDAPEGARDWWLVSDNGEIDLCLTDNGFDVDILVQCSLRTMIAVWTCRRRFDEAVVSRDISVKGAPRLSASLQAWLGASALSRLGAQGPQPVA